MSLKDRISSSIYHELQEPDSSLCAQHCLNNLVQDGIWTAADLADLARQLDEREDEARGGVPAANEGGNASGSSSSGGGGRRRQASPPAAGAAWGGARSNLLNADRSQNMDDSGFFSSQVMDEALKTYSLQLVRWRHPSLRSVQEAPEQQEAFVLNLSQHWFVIRRFGHSKHFWFDLNSFHPKPKHVSPLYLGLQIDQAEHEGYNVFVVLSSSSSSSSSSTDLSGTTPPPSEADDAVFKLAEEARTSAGLQSLTSPTAGVIPDRRSQAMLDDETIFTSSGQGPAIDSSAGGFGNEDAELNKAIEESLRGHSASGSGSGSGYGKITAPKMPNSSGAGGQAPPLGPGGAFDNDDPELAAAIAASLEMENQGGNGAGPPTNTKEKDSTKPAKEKEDEDFWKDDAAMDADEGDGGDDDAEMDEEEDEEEEQEQEEKAPTAEELRARRLARFG